VRPATREPAALGHRRLKKGDPAAELSRPTANAVNLNVVWMTVTTGRVIPDQQIRTLRHHDTCHARGGSVDVNLGERHCD
jgi:hypothetical protein